MAKVPVVSGREMIRLLTKAGFQQVRQSSHLRLVKGPVVPLHDDLSKGTLLGILDQCGLSREDFFALLDG